jgi:O-antigen ligase
MTPASETLHHPTSSDADISTNLVLKPAKHRETLGLVFAGLMVFLAVYFLRPEDWIPGLESVHLGKITGTLTLVALVFCFRDIRWQVPREIVLLLLLTLQLWLTVPFSSVWRRGAFNYMLGFSTFLPVVFVMYIAVRSMPRLRGVLLLQSASVAAIAVTSLFAAATPGDRLQGAISGIYGNSNDLALIIDLTLPLCFAFALSARDVWKKVVWAIVMIFMTYAVLLTASRAGALSLAVAVTVCIWRLGVKDRRFYVLLLVPVVLLTVWLLGGKSLERRIELSDTDSSNMHILSETEGSTLQRQSLLVESLKVTAQHPLLGIGPGNFEIVSGVWRVTHNTYTQMSSEGGIPAFILYVLILWCAVTNLRAVRKLRTATGDLRVFSIALEASVYTYLVGSFFASVGYQLYPYCMVAYTTAFRLIAAKTAVPVPAPTNSQLEPAQLPAEAVIWE